MSRLAYETAFFLTCVVIAAATIAGVEHAQRWAVALTLVLVSTAELHRHIDRHRAGLREQERE